MTYIFKNNKICPQRAIPQLFAGFLIYIVITSFTTATWDMSGLFSNLFSFSQAGSSFRGRTQFMQGFSIHSSLCYGIFRFKHITKLVLSLTMS